MSLNLHHNKIGKEMRIIIFNFLLTINSMLFSQAIYKNIETESIFPSINDEYFFVYPTCFQFDEENNIYVLDFRQNQILKIDSSGNLIQRIGSAGAAPGQFKGASKFQYAQKKLFVLDVQNGRFQILSKEGNYLKSFAIYDVHYSFVIPENSNYMFTTILNDNATKYTFPLKLLTKLDFEGELQEGFGEYLFDNSITKHTSINLLKIFNNKIYVLFRLYPILHVYDLNGNLLNSVELTGRNYKERISNNYDFSNLKVNQHIYPTRYLFNCYDVTKNGIYLGIYDTDSLIIDKYTTDFNYEYSIVNKYSDKDTDFYLMDFKVVKENTDSIQLYILSREEVFTIKKIKVTLKR